MERPDGPEENLSESKKSGQQSRRRKRSYLPGPSARSAKGDQKNVNCRNGGTKIAINKFSQPFRRTRREILKLTPADPTKMSDGKEKQRREKSQRVPGCAKTQSEELGIEIERKKSKRNLRRDVF